MAEEVVFSAEGAASINEADASPKPAFEDMEQKLLALGMSEEDMRDMVVSYCKERSENPMSKEEAYKLAFRCVVAQWVTRLVRFGGYTYQEIPAVFGEFGEGLARNTTGTLPTPRETAISSLSSLYYSLRVRGVSDEELLAATRSLAKNALEVEEDAHEGMKGVSGVGAAQALADNLGSIRKYGIANEDLESVGQEFWKQVHEGDQSAQYAWKKAFFGVLIQWMYRLSLEAGLKEQLNEVMAETVAKLQTEAGRDVQDIAREALDTYYAYMTVSGYSDKDIQAQLEGLLA